MENLWKRDKMIWARGVLRNIYNVDEDDIITMASRDSNKVAARKMYNYYLWKYLGIKHNHMKNYIKGMHHSTSIYLKTNFEFEVSHYPGLESDWITFLYFTDNEVWNKLTSVKKIKKRFLTKK